MKDINHLNHCNNCSVFIIKPIEVQTNGCKQCKHNKNMKYDTFINQTDTVITVFIMIN